MAETLDGATYEDPYDLGHGVTAYYVGWHPDRELNPQYEDVPDEPRYALNLLHSRPDGSPCTGAVTLESDAQRRVDPGHTTWTVESRDPLTLSPSVLCGCGLHGFVREGRWVPA